MGERKSLGKRAGRESVAGNFKPYMGKGGDKKV